MGHEYFLDALNFFLADVRQGLGAYLAVFLLSERHWSEDQIGLVMSIALASGLIAQTPAGALIDISRAKRAIIVSAAVVVIVSSIVSPFVGSFIFQAGSQAAAGAADTFFGPAIAAITLGIVGPGAFTRRIGRNEAFNHAGNAFAAVLAGLLSSFWGPSSVFYFIAGMALLSSASVLTIPAEAIDHERARALRDGPADSHESPSRINLLMSNRSLLVFCICCVLFQLADAAMLPLVGEKLTLEDKSQSTTLMSTCIVVAQGFMVPMAILVGKKADDWGRKSLFLAGFAVLSLRGCLYVLSDDRYWLIAVQSLDGLGAGLYFTLLPLIIADLTRGTGHFNLAQGAVITAQSIGAAVSTSLAGFVTVHAGYSVAFLVLAAIAVSGFGLYFFGMPETGDAAKRTAEATAKLAPT